MSRPGPKPEPPTLSVVPFAGSRESGGPPKPPEIAANPAASAEWDRVVSLLSANRTLSAEDAALLTAYCSAYATLVACLSKIAEPGFQFTTVNDKTGAEKANPVFGVKSGAETNLARFASLLGLTPVDRGRGKSKGVAAPEKKISKYLK